VPRWCEDQDLLPLSAVEERYLRWAAGTFLGDKASLAQKLGIGERTLYRKLRQLRVPEGGADET
jgi:DNA-binding NtrC family response regulator